MITVLPLLTSADTINFQVSHHPPAAAHHVTSQRGWTLWQHITIDSKFRGKYISVVPLGKKHVRNLPWCCSLYRKMYNYKIWIFVGTWIIYKPLMFVLVVYCISSLKETSTCSSTQMETTMCGAKWLQQCTTLLWGSFGLIRSAPCQVFSTLIVSNKTCLWLSVPLCQKGGN